jgi:purine nucleosidase
MRARPVVLDVDTGVDDALAILLTLRSPEFAVQGICTVSGNAPLLQTTANTCRVLDVAGASDIPVVAGAAAPLARPGITAGEVHGGDGLGGMADRLRRVPEALTLIATGPLTNVAQAIRQDVATMRRLRALTIMGGAICVPGNVGPVSEFNFAVDPEAAAIVLGAGLPVTLVPLDVTERVTLTRQAADAAATEGAVPTFVRRITAATMAFHRQRYGEEGIFLHDPLAVGVTLDPSFVRQESIAVAVETRGTLTAGMTVADLRRGSHAVPTAQVCLEVDAERFLRLFTQRVLR